MSAIRRSDRRSNRLNSSPYARPPSKKPSWSISGLLSYFIPLRLRSSSPQQEDEPESSLPSTTATGPNLQSAAERLVDRGQELSQSLNGRHNAVAGPSSLSSLQSQSAQPLPALFNTAAISSRNETAAHYAPIETTSQFPNIETVTTFLQGKRGQQLNDVEIEGLIAMIKKSNAQEESEPFRFSSSTPSTPGRGNSPNYGFGPTSSASMPAVSENSRKVLTKNPNGVYRWEGGGSARPRNRYRSPAFGSSKSTPSGLRLSVPLETPKSDNKRRRVGEDADTSMSEPSYVQISARSAAPSPAQVPAGVPFPVTPGSPSPVNGGVSPSKVNGTTTPRLRTVIPLKPTTPAIPSPLRQAWGNQSDSSESSPPPSFSKPTKAASFMAQLIKEATPPKKPDVSNPYQTASPVKPSQPPKRAARMKRSRATGKPAPPSVPEVKEPELTMQAIIQATVPKGSKRSRPSADLVHSSASAKVNGSAPKQDVMDVDTADEDERAASPPKKQKKAIINGNGHPPMQRMTHKFTPTVTIEEIPDEDADTLQLPPTPILKPAEIIEPQEQSSSKTPNENFLPPPPTSSSSSFFAPTSPLGRLPGGKKSSLPKEPSKLRFSYQPEPSSSPIPASSAPAPALLSPATSFSATTSQPMSVDEAPKQKKSGKEMAQEAMISALPTFVFMFTAPDTPSLLSNPAKVEARSALASSLPTFDFTAPLAQPAKPATLASTGGFNWAAAGLAPPPQSSKSGWKCDLCGLMNGDDVNEKCQVCEKPRPKPAGAPQPSSFNWAAAGMAPPRKPIESAWTCGLCGLSNPAEAVEKCKICDNPR